MEHETDPGYSGWPEQSIWEFLPSAKPRLNATHPWAQQPPPGVTRSEWQGSDEAKRIVGQRLPN